VGGKVRQLLECGSPLPLFCRDNDDKLWDELVIEK
jgi:hypothetical protein